MNYTAEVGNTSTLICGERKFTTYLEWAAGAISAGAYRRVDNQKYLCITGGTAANEPSNGPEDGDQTTADSLVWRPLPFYERRRITIVNDSDETVYLTIGEAAVVGEGVRLNANGGSWTATWPTCPQDAIYAICASGSKDVTVTEG